MSGNPGPVRSRRRRQRCEYPGCPSFARLGEPFCHQHRNTRIDDVVEPELVGLTYAERVEARAELGRERRRREFEERLASGDYRRIFGVRVGVLIEQAAADSGLREERGVLRVALAMLAARLEDPDEDLHETARTIATVSRAAVLVERGQRAASGELVASITQAVYEALGELDGEEHEG